MTGSATDNNVATGNSRAAHPAPALCAKLGIRYPIVQDGMGPFRTARLAAAVSEAGGLGTVSMPGMTAEPEAGKRLLREEIDETAALTTGPFAVNVPVGIGSAGAVLPVTEAYITATIEARRADSRLADQLVGITTSAGWPGDYTRRIHEAGMLHLHKVGAVRHAVKAAANGADIIIASGYEMGGHTHARPVHTMVLAPQVIAAVDCPVLVSGGVFDGRGLAAALAMGAAGVAMGTRFIATTDNEWHPAYKQRIIDAGEWSDVVFPGVYGPARGLGNDGTAELAALVDGQVMSEQELTEWKDVRMTAAMRDGDVEHGLLPAGQCAAAIRRLATVADLLPAMAEQARALLATASASLPAAGVQLTGTAR